MYSVDSEKENKKYEKLILYGWWISVPSEAVECMAYMVAY
jgi:hypothetical protein